jgi:hypothetical protein
MKIRIAVVVDDTGKWNSYGWSGSTDEGSMSTAIDGLDSDRDHSRFFVEAEIPDSKPVPTIKASKVEEA